MKRTRKAIALWLLSAALLLAGCGPNSKTAAVPGRAGNQLATAAEAAQSLPPLPLPDKGTNPLTGLPLANPQAAGQRPVAIMVGNQQPSLPQRGLAAADVVYELPIEANSTRLMALYHDRTAIPQVGPVRSISDGFVQMALPSNAILTHIGSTQYADNLLNLLKYQDLNGLYLGSSAFAFDQARTLPKSVGKLNENCWFTDAGLVQAGIGTAAVVPDGEIPQLFQFSDNRKDSDQPAQWINLSFSDIAQAGFFYNAQTGQYTKTIGASAHVDEDGTPLTYTNLLILTAPITKKADGYQPEIDLREGSGLYLTKGTVQPITWHKGSPTQPLRLLDQNKTELQLHTGKTYLAFLPQDRDAAYSFGPYNADNTPNLEAATIYSAVPLPEAPVSSSQPVESGPPQSVVPTPGSFPPPPQTPPQEYPEAAPPPPPEGEAEAAASTPG